MIELAGRNCLIVSDSDNAAREQKKTYERDKGFGQWKLYQDIDATIDAVTGEDFVINDFIAAPVNVALTEGMPEFTTTVLPPSRGKLSCIKKWLADNGMNEQQTIDALSCIKDTIFEQLSCADIEPSYKKILIGIDV